MIVAVPGSKMQKIKCQVLSDLDIYITPSNGMLGLYTSAALHMLLLLHLQIGT